MSTTIPSKWYTTARKTNLCRARGKSTPADTGSKDKQQAYSKNTGRITKSPSPNEFPLHTIYPTVSLLYTDSLPRCWYYVPWFGCFWVLRFFDLPRSDTCFPLCSPISLFAKLVRILIPSIVVAPAPPFAQTRTQLVVDTSNPYCSFREY